MIPTNPDDLLFLVAVMASFLALALAVIVFLRGAWLLLRLLATGLCRSWRAFWKVAP